MKTAQKVLLILVAVLLAGFCAVDYILPDGITSLLASFQTASTVSGDVSSSGSADASAEDEYPEQDASSASDAEGEASASEVTTEVTIPQYDLTVCLDPGHGGNDPGCVTDDGREESADVLNLALLVKEKLEFYGVTVVMTRETDQYVSLSDRCVTANDAGADLFVSIHRNILTEDPSTCGVEAWVQAKYTQEEYDLAANILEELRLAGIQEMRGISSGTETSGTRNYYVCSVTDMPAVLLELGFMSNEEDNALYDTNMDAYAQAIADGLIATWVQYGGESVGAETYSVSLVNSYIIAQQARGESGADSTVEADQTDESQPVSGTVNDTVNLRSGPGTDYDRVTTIRSG
ncbi:MAG: N-acetylmuramoyl-L-alanine amidase, partial [Clostridiales bacterium]|nr:N-acetylmuramoyl-L-alanine amidase [Clostridiales bacterium]